MVKIDHKTSKSWTRNKDISSKLAAYAFAIKDQDIAAKYIKAKWQKGNTSNTITDTKYRLCKSANELPHDVYALLPSSSTWRYCENGL